MGEKKLKSIDELAQLAGVAKSTVSRALNDSPLVNAETKARILEIAKLHEFQPSVVARNLSCRSSRTIAYVTHAYVGEKGCDCCVSDPFSLEIMGGIAIGLHELGYDLLIVHIDPDDTGWAPEYLDSGRPIVALDGCQLQCVRNTLARHAIAPDRHFQLQEQGVRKKLHQDFDPEQAEEVIEHVLADLRAQPLPLRSASSNATQPDAT